MRFRNQNMRRYRSGHNGADSKTCRSVGVLTAESVGITGVLEISTLFNGFISTDFLHFFYAFYAVFDHLVSGQSVEKSICSGIEAVITGLTRNQFAGNQIVLLAYCEPRSRYAAT